METSAIQSIKLAIVGFSGLSKDALHVYVGLTVFLFAAVVHRRGLKSLWPLGAAVLVAAVGELLDMRDDFRSLGHWRWRASLHDVVNTVFWPLVWWLLARTRLL